MKRNVLLLLLSLFFIACNKDEESYPSVTLEILTIKVDAQNHLKSLVRDNGEVLQVTNLVSVDATKNGARVVTYYELESTTDYTAVVYAYAPILDFKPAQLTERVPVRDPMGVQSIWKTETHLNLILTLMGKDQSHLVNLIEDSIRNEKEDVYLSIEHDKKEDLPAFTQKVYGSMPLKYYPDAKRIHISIYTNTEIQTFHFNVTGINQ